MARITKNLIVTVLVMAVSQRMAIAQTSSTDEYAHRLDLAASQATQGLLVQARETLGKILSTPPKASDPPEWALARIRAQKIDDELKERLGTLRFQVTGLSAGMLPSIWVDENVNAVPADTPLRVNPGRHVIVAKTDSQQVSQTVEARERSTTSVALAFAPQGAAPASDVIDPATGQPKRTGLPTAAYWGLGIGAAGFMVGSVTGILGMISKKPNDPRCAASQCPPSSWNDYDPSTKILMRTSTASLVIGAAGVGLALGSILLNKKHDKHEDPGKTTARSVAESVSVTPAVGGVGVSGKW
jgi:hypothetical protein